MARKLSSRLIHYTYGLLTSIFFFLLDPYFALLNYIAFHVYELVEFYSIRDKAWHDLREYYAGLATGGLLFLIL